MRKVYSNVNMKRRGHTLFGTATAFVSLLIAACHDGGMRSAGNQDKFADHIRTTEFQTPEQEMAGFKLPPGFEITLFASEPDITKPINMEFDDRGRLWVSQSSEYPIAAGPGAGRDRISILEDTDGDGRADRFTHVDDSLNIPIGVMPLPTGDAIGYSIPYLYRLGNPDGADAESKKTVFGPFGFNDTHGMINNLFRGFDGWIHACHGFTNVSTIAGADGDSITLVSGNTFRFRIDGSRLEQTTHGRINPFGMAIDERGYLYSVDCHSKPIFQLISGGDYPQWGRKDPAIGYAPEMMSYELGSTALAGLVQYASSQFPEAYRGSFFTGDVVTCRIDRNTVTYQGSTPVASKEEPFLTSEDPWFRPVDLKIGPDGSLYVADFYNRIIGHYEVSLDHPGRDRLSGRIWKITYTGKDKGTVPERDWSTASLDELIDGLAHPQLSTRLKVADRLVEVVGQPVAGPVEARLKPDGWPSTAGYVHGLWILHRLGALTPARHAEAMLHADAIVRQHALRILGESAGLSEPKHEAVLAALSDSDPFIQRTAAEVLGRFPRAAHVSPLLALYQSCPAADTHLKYTALLALRNNLLDRTVRRYVGGKSWADTELPTLVRAMRDVPSAEAGSFVMDYTLRHDVQGDELRKNLEFIGRFASAQELDRMVPTVTARFANDQRTQLALFRDIRQGIAQRGSALPSRVKAWGQELAQYFLRDIGGSDEGWVSIPLHDRLEDQLPWMVSDGFLVQVVPPFRIYFSERQGYKPMAALRSAAFELPEKLQMNVFDNDVHHMDGRVGVSKNTVRIRLAADDRIVAEYRVKYDTPMEFNELIKQASFDLSAHAGQRGYIEVLDSTETGAIGIGKLEPTVVEMPSYTPSDRDDWRQHAAEVAGDFRMASLRGSLAMLLKDHHSAIGTRLAAANALANMPSETDAMLFGDLFVDNSQPVLLRERLAANLGQLKDKRSLAYLRDGLVGGSRSVQLAAAAALAGSTVGVDQLLEAMNANAAPVDLLAEFKVKEVWQAHASSAQQAQVSALLAKGGDERESRRKLIEQRIAGFAADKKRIPQGRALYEANCASCHQIGGRGGLIGPQLDGIGNWGVQALTEKILDPNRNISESFRTYTINMKNGTRLSGLYRRTEGEVLVFADIGGREFQVAKGEMESYTPSPYTLMPDQFRHTLSEADFGALMDYLLSVK